MIRSDEEPPPAPVAIIMGSDDESVPFARVAGRWRSWLESGRLVEGSRLVTVEGGDHGLLDHVETIADEIRAAVRKGSARGFLASDVW